MNNIFISRPSTIGPDFEKAYIKFEKYLKRIKCKPNRLGSSRYTLDAPLTAVISIISECVGAIILGYPQLEFKSSFMKGSEVQGYIDMVYPTPWNHI